MCGLHTQRPPESRQTHFKVEGDHITLSPFGEGDRARPSERALTLHTEIHEEGEGGKEEKMKLDTDQYGLEKKEDGTYATRKKGGLKAEMLGEPGASCEATVVTVREHTFSPEDGPKVIVALNIPSLGDTAAERNQELTLNKTNLQSMLNAFGDDTDAWEGSEVRLNVETTQYQGENVPCVRIYGAE